MRGRVVLRVTTIATMALLGLGSLAHAESIERPWRGDKKPAKTTKTGVLNSFLPAAAIKEQPKSRVQKKVRGKVTKKRPVAGKVPERLKPSPEAIKARKKKIKEAKWWTDVANPVVFAFRDCSATYARAELAAGRKRKAADFITLSMRSRCKSQFAKMAGVLIGGLGEKRSNVMLKELAHTTFLPTVRQAIADHEQARQLAHSAIAAKQSQKRNAEQELTRAKATMFACFKTRADNLAVANGIDAGTVADAVIAGCRSEADRFFGFLFAKSRAGLDVKNAQKNLALKEIYRGAIIKRISIMRVRQKVKTAGQ